MLKSELAAADTSAQYFVYLPVAVRNPTTSPPGIMAQPSSATVTEPHAVAFTVIAAGNAPLTYQWRRNGANIGGATGATYILNATSVADSGAKFDVVISNPYGSITSQTATLTVKAAPILPHILVQPTAVTVMEQEPVTFTVAANGDPPLSYQWRRNGVNISGATSASYLLSSPSLADNGAQFDVIVSSPYGSVTSQAVTLTVNPIPVPPGITTQPVNVMVIEPEAATFTVVASGDEPLSYQWRRNSVDIPGAIDAIYVLDPTSVADSGAQFDVVVSNVHGSLTSQAATLTVVAPAGIVTQPADVTVTRPQAATFTVVASGDEPLSYQWRRNGVNISGATAATYVLSPTSAADNGAQFDVIVSNPYGSITSQTATLTANPPAVNTKPLAADDAYSVISGGTINTVAQGLGGVLANDYDADGDFLTAVLVDNVVNGTLSLNADGSFTYSHSGNDHVSLKLSPGGNDSLTEYGVATAIDGDTLVVGSNSREGGKNFAGAVYVFVRQGARWNLQKKITPTDPMQNHFFGWAVDISGDTIVIGAPGDSKGDKTYEGAAYVFVRSGINWSQQAKIVGSDTAAGDEFGGAVAIDGHTIAVGAYYNDHGGHSNAGAAYVFVRNGSSWSQQAKLIASDRSAEAWLGLGLAVDGNTVAVGALNDDAAGTNAGAAYVYVRNGSSWSQQAKLTAADAAAGNTFGFAAALQGNTLVIGANGYEVSSGYAGAAYVFERNGSSWSQKQKLLAPDVTSTGIFGFGVAVAFDGDTIVVGAHGDDAQGTNAGSAYVFTRSGSTWIQQNKLLALEPANGNEFGVAVAVGGDYVVIGANSDKFKLEPDQKAGSAYVYQIGGTLTDSFTYRANDGNDNSNIATVLITLK